MYIYRRTYRDRELYWVSMNTYVDGLTLIVSYIESVWVFIDGLSLIVIITLNQFPTNIYFSIW